MEWCLLCRQPLDRYEVVTGVYGAPRNGDPLNGPQYAHYDCFIRVQIVAHNPVSPAEEHPSWALRRQTLRLLGVGA